MKNATFTIYIHMERHYGFTGWWPGETPFEIAIGAILTQNTAWTNVEKAIANLKAADLLGPRRLLACQDDQLYAALRPSGYFRVKAIRVRAFCDYLVRRHRGSMARLAAVPLTQLREELLGISGIGPETADDILLYACEKPVFVVDAYTRRILGRHGVVDPKVGYEDLQTLFEGHLPKDVALFKEYHGLLVYVGKDFCRKRPRCEACPLKPLLKDGQPLHCGP